MRQCYNCGLELDLRTKIDDCPKCKVKLNYVFKEKTNNEPLIKGD